MAFRKHDNLDTRRLRSPVSIDGDGHSIPIAWDSVAGATKVEVSEARVILDPASVEETFDDVPFSADGASWVVNIPAGKRVKALSLHGFKQPGGAELKSSGDLGSMRIAVAFPPVKGGGWDSPRFSVPAVRAQNMVPDTLTGATFSNRLLTLGPSVAAARVRISLVTGVSPAEFVAQTTELAAVHLTTETPALNMKVLAPDNTSVWEMPEFDPEAPSADVDLRFSLEHALNEKLKQNQPLDATFTVRADEPADAFVSARTPKGFVLRVRDGVLVTEISGDPVALALGEPLASETPHSVTGDLTIHYAGIRILETVSDPLPPLNAPIAGVIVGEREAVRAFPPQGLDGVKPACIGVVGRAPEDCELSMEFVEMNGESAGRPLGPPALVVPPPDRAIRTHWADVPEGTALQGPVGLRVRANRGRFFWVAAPQPLVRVAIYDPDPAGRPIYLGSAHLIDVNEEESHHPAFTYPKGVFRNAAPELHSDLFLTVDVSDLTLRYAR